ncbi:hypothetical protein AMR71_03305 [Bacillus altitudinis]|nr:hypothetical protein AKO65_06990 [Bacillus altitudinis]ALM44312.1 hypothetical protein AMR71_03305 [Bacillus altitudinis]ANY95787.1 hypothetical protein AKO66_03305 [Bacillus altitudinis]
MISLDEKKMFLIAGAVLTILVSAAFFFVVFLLIEYLTPKCSILKGRFLLRVMSHGREGMVVLEIKIKSDTNFSSYFCVLL